MTHPLTDDIIHTMWGKGDPSQKFEYRLARASADWQLEQVIEWLGKYETIGLEEHDLVVRLIHDLKKAMRPQEDTP